MKKILTLILFIPILTFGQCVLGDCEDGYGVYKESNGDIYSGEWKDGMKNGFGYLEINEGGHYFGQFKYDKKEGFAYFVSPERNVYFGEMKENKKSGYGYYEYPNNIGFYRGEFLNDVRHGLGLYADVSGEEDRWNMGDWINDEPQGKAKKAKKKLVVGCLAGDCRKNKGLYISDRVSLGSWTKGKLNGKALLTAGADVAIGTVIDNIFNGEVLYVWGATQEFYFGEFLDGRRQGGHSMVKKRDSEIFIGDMLAGVENNGKGLSIVQNKNKPNEYFIGKWRNGKVVEVESYIFE